MLEANVDKLIEYAEDLLPNYEPCHTVVCKLQPDQILKVATTLQKYQPYYCSVLSEPLFEVEFDYSVYGCDFAIIGKANNTAKFTLPNFTAIKFNSPNFEPPSNNTTVRAIGKLNLNEWNGEITPQLIITDYEYLEPDKYNML